MWEKPAVILMGFSMHGTMSLSGNFQRDMTKTGIQYQWDVVPMSQGRDIVTTKTFLMGHLEFEWDIVAMASSIKITEPVTRGSVG